MSILTRIGEAKRAFQEKKSRITERVSKIGAGYRAEINKSKAVELQRLKKKRERLEGEARLKKLKDKELGRIEKARSRTRKDLNNRYNKPTRIKGSNKKTEPSRRFGEGINPAFGLGKGK